MPIRLNKGEDAWAILKRRIFSGGQIKIKIKMDLYNASIGRRTKYSLATLRTAKLADANYNNFPLNV